MDWYNRLYVGKKAKKRRKYIIEHIRYEKYQPGVYVITPAENGNNILDIYPAAELLLPAFRGDLLILGIADDYWEALSVAAQIIDDMYQETGGFDLDTFLSHREEQ